MFPLKSEPIMDIDHPILFINSHTFNIPPNLNVLRKYIESEGDRRVVTLKKTTHESYTDTAFIHGYWLDLFMLKKMNPETALNLLSSIAVKYLSDKIGTNIMHKLLHYYYYYYFKIKFFFFLQII